MPRKFLISTADQRSPQWFFDRVGRLTGSKAADVIAFLKDGKTESAARRDYRLQLVCERLTGQPQESTFVNEAMQRGIELEPKAFAAYESLTGLMATRAGFLYWPDLPVGCSLDGYVGDFEGIVELKCPKTATHVGYLRDGGMPKEHVAQVTHNLWITGAPWCDFVSFDDRLPERLQTFHVRVEASRLDLAGYEAAAMRFLEEVEREHRSLLPISEQLEVA